MNAIERLWHGCTHYEYARDIEAESEAHLAVDALYQAAKEVVAAHAPRDPEGWISLAEATVALAAAVRRIDGET